MAKYALTSWAGQYPEIYDSREIGGEVQHYLKRAFFQGDEGKHWFCGCDEFQSALMSQPNGTLSSIVNAKPLTCSHITEIDPGQE